MPSPLDRLRQKFHKWMIILVGGFLVLMVAASLTATLLFFIGMAILAGYVLQGISKDIRCPFCGLFDPVGMVRVELEDLFKRRSTCRQCRRELTTTVPTTADGQP